MSSEHQTHSAPSSTKKSAPAPIRSEPHDWSSEVSPTAQAAPLSAAQLLQLQRTVGNRTTQRLILNHRRRAVSNRTHQTTLQRFEARMHESAERVGLTSNADGTPAARGMSNDEATAVYMGNWMRDLNQVFVPKARELGLTDDAAFALITYLAAKKFGRRISPEQFGYYIPAEHIDNPGGLTNSDVLTSPPRVTGPTHQAAARPAEFVTPQEDVTPNGRVLGANLFDVDQTGTMAFIRRTNLHVERRLELAALRGRTPEGMMHFGAALHAIEDLFAHSNWIEMAVNKILQDQPTLLRGLQGGDRHIFDYAVEVDVPAGGGRTTRRPVLTTGTFTGTDTQVSIASELYTVLVTPLDAPASDEINEAQQQMILQLLRTMQNQVQNNAELQQNLRQILAQNGVPDMVSQRLLQMPVAQLYEISTAIGPLLPEGARIAVQTAIRNAVSTSVLQPIGKRMQADSLDARISSTSLINDMRNNERGQTAPNPTRAPGEPADVYAQRLRSAQAGRDSAREHAAVEHNTPVPVIAGPSHSQIAKDHPNSPFFGLAFTLATVAVRRMRERMVAAWDALAGGQTRAFDFNRPNATGDEIHQSGGEATREPTGIAGQLGEIFTGEGRERARTRRAHQGAGASRRERQNDAAESLAQGQAIVRDGGLGPRYDLAAMRLDSANQLRAVANTLRSLAGAPGATAVQLTRLQQLLGELSPERTGRIQERLAQAASGARAAGHSTTAAEWNALAGDLDAVAAQIQNAASHQQRSVSNEALRNLLQRILRAVASTPSVSSAVSTAMIAILDEQISYTQVTYTDEQRNALATHGAGSRFNNFGNADPNFPLNPQTLRVHNITLPSTTTNAQGQQRNPMVAAVLAESRVLLNHPYEDAWWIPTVQQYLTQHEARIIEDIRARNSGVPFFRRPGEHAIGGDGHQH